MIPLFEYHPRLAAVLPYVSLGQFPTPVQKLEHLGSELGVNQLYVKNDGLSGKAYGGNKVRKLEFLLGDALRRGAKEVLTFGGAGSNHALATAVYARQLGLRSISILRPQPNAHYVRRNLLMSYQCGAELHHYPSKLLVILGTRYQLIRHRARYGAFPKVIPMGGSSPLGVTGCVNAAIELREQIRRGEMPEPQRVYVALGSMGTAAGLALGLKAAGLRSQVIAVRVIGDSTANQRKLSRLYNQTGVFLHALDPSFPRLEISGKDLDIRHQFFGHQYGLFTDKAMEAVRLAEKSESIRLEGTYTGKAFAALIQDARTGGLSDQVVLFWNTHNARDLSDSIAGLDYHRLPPCFHRYFTQDVQSLDGHP